MHQSQSAMALAAGTLRGVACRASIAAVLAIGALGAGPVLAMMPQGTVGQQGGETGTGTMTGVDAQERTVMIDGLTWAVAPGVPLPTKAQDIVRYTVGYDRAGNQVITKILPSAQNPDVRVPASGWSITPQQPAKAAKALLK